MTKYVLTLLLACCPLLAFCQENSAEPIALSGHWKEVHRMDEHNKAISYTDTLRLRFLVGNEYVWVRPGSFSYRGTYKATRSYLDMGGRNYNIVQRSPNRMLLKDRAGTYELIRYEEPPVREDNSQARTGDRHQSDERYDGLRDFKKMKGKWQVYKRTAAIQLDEVNYDRIIKTIHVPDTNGHMGSVYAANDGSKPSWYIDRFDKSILYCTGKDKRQLQVLKCDGEELVIREGNLTYFFKQFQ
jgi:hypothetical protein